MTLPQKDKHHIETRLVHEGHDRTPYGETAEALFLTQGFVYESAESAEAALPERGAGLQLQPVFQPDHDQFEQRMATLEGAEAARATATGMAAVTAAMVGQVQAGDHVVAARALFGSCRWVVEDLLPRFGVGCTLVDGAQSRSMARSRHAGDKGVFARNADQSEPRDHRHRARSPTSPMRPVRR